MRPHIVPTASLIGTFFSLAVTCKGRFVVEWTREL